MCPPRSITLRPKQPTTSPTVVDTCVVPLQKMKQQSVFILHCLPLPLQIKYGPIFTLKLSETLIFCTRESLKLLTGSNFCQCLSGPFGECLTSTFTTEITKVFASWAKCIKYWENSDVCEISNYTAGAAVRPLAITWMNVLKSTSSIVTQLVSGLCQQQAQMLQTHCHTVISLL